MQGKKLKNGFGFRSGGIYKHKSGFEIYRKVKSEAGDFDRVLKNQDEIKRLFGIIFNSNARETRISGTISPDILPIYKFVQIH